MTLDVLICGVGGQGTVLASKLLAQAAMEEGHTVHSAETIGMAQRGGSVTSHVRMGEEAYSPLIPLGGADLILAFEPSEAVRNLMYLKEEGAVVVNRQPVKPTTESLQDTGYDGREMIAFLQKKCAKCTVVDADELLESLGSARYFNVAILGTAVGAGTLPISRDTLLSVIERTVSPRFVDADKEALLLGIRAGEGSL